MRIAPLLALSFGLVLATLPGGARALTLAFPDGAHITATKVARNGTYNLPIGSWRGGSAPTVTAEGLVEQTAWRIEKRGVSTLTLLKDLRGQLTGRGYRVLFQCATRACGGFDFRYGLTLLPEPQMHVDLGDFRYLTAVLQTESGPDYVGLMVSRSNDAGFVQITSVIPNAPAAGTAGTAQAQAQAQAAAQPSVGADATVQSIGKALETGGAVALDDLNFAPGASTLTEGSYGSLSALAGYLKGHPGQSVALVGHTDDKGSLKTNIALSKKRAESVRQRLLDTYGVSPAQVIAEGVGFLAPRATNLTKVGRTKNRRVEVMLTSTQ